MASNAVYEGQCIPRLYAAASLKRAADCAGGVRGVCIPRLYAAASLKPASVRNESACCRGYSAALCRGLIEAYPANSAAWPARQSIPRLYAAASLKLGFCLLQAFFWDLYSAALCRGLIEARARESRRSSRVRCIPRLYAAASLKRHQPNTAAPSTMQVFRGFMPRPH